MAAQVQEVSAVRFSLQMIHSRTLIKIAGAGLFALVAGVGSAWLAIHGAMHAAGVTNGPWVTSLAIGSPAADPYTRALVAVTGLLALNRSEAIYFTATHDGEGRPLNGDCSYRVRGEDLPARWWSLTAYGADHYLIANAADRYSFSPASLARGGDTPEWEVTVAAQPQPGNWLPVEAGAPFSLTLRLYNPEPEAVAAPEAIRLPAITRISCVREDGR